MLCKRKEKSNEPRKFAFEEAIKLYQIFIRKSNTITRMKRIGGENMENKRITQKVTCPNCKKTSEYWLYRHHSKIINYCQLCGYKFSYLKKLINRVKLFLSHICDNI